jgi:hypothetical protein
MTRITLLLPPLPLPLQLRGCHVPLDGSYDGFGYLLLMLHWPFQISSDLVRSGVTTIEAFAFARSSLRLWQALCRNVDVAFDARPTLQWLLPWKAFLPRVSSS